MKWADVECTRHFEIIIFMSYCDFKCTDNKYNSFRYKYEEQQHNAFLHFSRRCHRYRRRGYNDCVILMLTLILMAETAEYSVSICKAFRCWCGQFYCSNQTKDWKRIIIINENIRNEKCFWLCLLFSKYYFVVNKRRMWLKICVRPRIIIILI